MPLSTMSLNVQELDAGRRKRCHDEFVEPARAGELNLKDIGAGRLVEQPRDDGLNESERL